MRAWGTNMSVTFDLAGARSADDTYLNLCNTNAAGLLEAVGLPIEPYGELAAAELPATIRRVLFALNTKNGRTSMIRETEAGTGTNGASWVSFGLDDDGAR